MYFTLVFVRALTGLLDVLGIALIGILAGLAASSFSSDSPLSIFGFELPQVSEQTLLILVLVVLAIFALKAAVAILFSRAIAVFLAKVESSKATEIATQLFSGNLANLNRLSTGEIAWAVMGSTSVAFSGLLTSLSTFVAEGILLILVALTFFLVDPIASIFVFAYFTVVIVVIQRVIQGALKKAGEDTAEGSTQSMVALSDTIGAFREISILNKKQFFINRFSAARFRLASSIGTTSFLNGMPRYVVETALMLGVVMFVGFQFLTGQLATGLVTVGIFLTGGVRVMGSLLPLQNALANVKIQVEQASLSQRLLSEAPEGATHTQSRPAIVSPPENLSDTNLSGLGLEVVMSDVTFTYDESSQPALEGIALHIKGGQHVAIIGPSGAGKTTLVDIILGLIEPSAGYLRVGNQTQNHAALIQKGLVAYVPQRPGMVTGSIAENVALGSELSEIDPERVHRALRAANLEDFVESLPQGIFTSVGSQANALSGGQIQRLGLARALYANPKLVVLDEATSALDASSEAFVTASLKHLGADVTVIVIAHRLSTIQHADNVFFIDGGKLVASGTFSHLRRTVPAVATYVDLMSFESLETET